MYNNLMKESISKSTSFIAQPIPNFNANMTPNPGNFIPFVAAPPQAEANPQNIASQLNNFAAANYNNMLMSNNPSSLGSNEMPGLVNYQNFNNMYQPYGQIDPVNSGQNLPPSQTVNINNPNIQAIQNAQLPMPPNMAYPNQQQANVQY